MLLYLGIGTNLGDREANLRRAVQLLNERVGECTACSSVYRSAPQGFVSDHTFANIVVACETAHSIEDVLLLTQQIEREMGRTKKSLNGIYHDRVIDIDILLLKDGNEWREYSTEELTIPHPRMRERDFVMIPLREVMHVLNEKIL